MWQVTYKKHARNTTVQAFKNKSDIEWFLLCMSNPEKRGKGKQATDLRWKKLNKG